MKPTPEEETPGQITPGEWIAKPFDEGQVMIVSQPHCKEHPLICIVSVGSGRPHGEANTRAICAIPALVAALQADIHMIENLLGDINAGRPLRPVRIAEGLTIRLQSLQSALKSAQSLSP